MEKPQKTLLAIFTVIAILIAMTVGAWFYKKPDASGTADELSKTAKQQNTAKDPIQQTNKNIPTEEEQRSLVKKSLRDYFVSAKNGNMEHFYDSISKDWKNRTTIEKIDKDSAFKAQNLTELAYDAKDLAVLDSIAPFFSQNALIDKNGLLVINGYYAAHGMGNSGVLTFEHKYVHEDATWKLTTFSIKGPTPPLTKEELISLVKKTMSEYYITSNADTKELEKKLKEYCAPYLNSEGKFTALESIEPVIENVKHKSEAKIENANNELTINGRYSTGPQIIFEQKYTSKDDASWKLSSLSFNCRQNASKDTSSDSKDIPSISTEDLITLAEKSMHDFSISVYKKSMEHFRGSLSKIAQQQFTTEKLNDKFAEFFDSGEQLAALDSLEPVITGFSQKQIIPDTPTRQALESNGSHESNGTLTINTIKGYYSSAPNKIQFEYGYTHEDGNWKLANFSVELIRTSKAVDQSTPKSDARNSTGKIPGEKDMISLTKKSIHDFSVSIKNKNMEYFRNSISNDWKGQVSFEDMNRIYGQFFNSEAKFTALESLEPVFEDDARIEKNGELLIKGHYSTDPQMVFEHKYIYEGATWKLSTFHFRFKTP
jgi:hypothetical protein